MDYVSLLAKEGSRVLITGDSLSYNRHPYDSEVRDNAHECGVGMESWSFRLRDALFTSGSQFIYGDEIAFSCKTICGIDNMSAVPNTAMFGGRIQTLYPDGDVSFTVPVKNDKIILYFQRRMDSACVFDIAVDGNPEMQDVDTQGHMDDFAGYGLLQIVLPCCLDKTEHTVTISNIRGEKPKITVAGVGTKDIRVDLSGSGGKTTRWLIENYEERIGKFHNLDLLILSLGANDRVFVAPEVFRCDLMELLSKIFEDSPECRILYVLPPASHYPPDPYKDIRLDTVYTSLDTAEVYDRVIRYVCNEFGEGQIDLLSLRELFNADDFRKWRYDSIHLSRYGNDVLFETVESKMGII